MEKFFRAQMVSFDRNTLCYWAVDDNGKERDLLADDVPEKAVVTDVTFDDLPKQVIKKNGRFELYEAS